MSIPKCGFLSCGRVLTCLIIVPLLGTISCNKVDQSPDKVFATITAGMTTAEVEKILGPGKEVSYEELPPLYRTVLDTPPNGTPAKKGEGVVYRKWSRTAGETSAISHVAFSDDKVVDGTVYVETVRVGK